MKLPSLKRLFRQARFRISDKNGRYELHERTPAGWSFRGMFSTHLEAETALFETAKRGGYQLRRRRRPF